MAPTQVVVDDLRANGFENVRLWSRGVDGDIFRPQPSKRLEQRAADLPVCRAASRSRKTSRPSSSSTCRGRSGWWARARRSTASASDFPQANYLGVLEREELAKVYAAADVFVFPSRTDTFGLVLLEAMACGLPVAAYPVTGPRDVIGDSKAGVLHEDLRTACLEALKLSREDALARARLFTWRAATEQFFGHLHPRKRACRVAGLRLIPQYKQSVAADALNSCRAPAGGLDHTCCLRSSLRCTQALSLYSPGTRGRVHHCISRNKKKTQLGQARPRPHGELRMSTDHRRAASATNRSAPTTSRIAV